MNHGWSAAGLLLIGSALVVPLVVYRLAVSEVGPGWPARYRACWAGGLGVLGVGVLLPGHGFTHQVLSHLLVGMVAPLLLALGRPVRLALRALPVARARTLVRLLRSLPLRTLGNPAIAALLNVGALWLLWTTPYADHPLVHVHMLLAGYLFTAAILGTHPRPAGFRFRAAVLVAASAGHGILAKYLYARSPGAEPGALLLYYGGDAVDLVLAVLFCRAWFRTLSPRRSAVPATGRRSCGSPPAPRSPSCR
ncbi:cytochrome c oxidase assembly protein [Cryptosporangium japonicum]|uniref:Cytochrome c oxidase assembly protein n=1 Tax=Cryptosporangium japonicum TaxID=80872 RepID=A0ABN0URK0_9ACTN